MDPDGPEVHETTRIKMMHVMKFAKGMSFLRDCQGLPGYVEGNPVLPLIDASMPDMITVVMGNDDSVDIADRTSPGCQLFFSLDAVYPCVNEESYSTRFHIDAVAVAAGLQRECQHDDRVLSDRLNH
jgi:hypothetical protein